jgi:uncharacterized membrane protein YqjE
MGSAGGALFIQALLHAQLARIEWQQEKTRLLWMLLILLLGFACLLCAMLLASALVLAVSWDTPYRVPALACLVLLHGLGVAVAWERFQRRSGLGGQTFAASLEELAADATLLRPT